MQLQADLAGCEVRASRVEEVGALGTAAMAMGGMEGTPCFLTPGSDVSRPQMQPTTRQASRVNWSEAIGQATR